MNVFWKKTRIGVVAVVVIGIMSGFGCSSERAEDTQPSESAAMTGIGETSTVIVSENARTSESFTENGTTKKPTEQVTPTTNKPKNPVVGMVPGALSQSLNGYQIEGEDNAQSFDISHLRLNATFASEQSTNEVMRTLVPSFNSANFEVYKNVDSINGSQEDFSLHYRLKIAEYETYKGYAVTYENNQAAQISEFGMSLPLPSATEIRKLPAVTEQIIQAAHKQGQEDLRAMNPNYVMVEQTDGYAFLDLATGECFYRVLNAYNTNDAIGSIGAFSTDYNIR